MWCGDNNIVRLCRSRLCGKSHNAYEKLLVFVLALSAPAPQTSLLRLLGLLFSLRSPSDSLSLFDPQFPTEAQNRIFIDVVQPADLSHAHPILHRQLTQHVALTDGVIHGRTL